MKASEQAIQKLAERVENAFENELDNKQLAEYEPYMYEEMVQTALKQMGFPDNANNQNVDFDFSIKSKIPYTEWAEIMFEQFAYHEGNPHALADDNIRMYILYHLDKADIKITANEEVSEFQEKHPTIEYLVEAIERHKNYDEFVEAIKQQAPDAVKEAVEQQANEEGINYDDISELEYNITHATQTISIEEYAEAVKSQIGIKYGTVANFAENHLYDDIIARNDYRFNIEISGGNKSEKTPEQLEKHPTIQYVLERAEAYYDEDTFKYIIRESRYGLLDKTREACDAEGISRDYAHQVNYRIMNLRFLLPFEDMAEVWAEETVDFNMTVTAYLKAHMYEFLLANCDYDVEITDDPEDYR